MKTARRIANDAREHAWEVASMNGRIVDASDMFSIAKRAAARRDFAFARSSFEIALHELAVAHDFRMGFHKS